MAPESTYRRIYALVKRIPKGRVATYGQIATLAGRCTPRQVGYAMAALPAHSGVPWHRVLNREGRVSQRSAGDGSLHQRALLEAEGVAFDRAGRCDLERVGWRPRRQAAPPPHRTSHPRPGPGKGRCR